MTMLQRPRAASMAQVSAGFVAQLIGVTKRYGTTAALQDVTLDVARGTVLGIVGRSGAGKSTLLRLLNGLEHPDAGSVRLEGADVTWLGERAWAPVRQRIGMVFQHFNLLSAKTVAANVALSLRIASVPERIRASRVAALLDLVGLADKAGAYPAQLSGGQKQRVGIARAMAAEPSLLLCDEATSALDPETTASILELLRNINREYGLSIVLITHELSVIRAVADTVAVLNAGRLTEHGPVADVLARPRSPAGLRLAASVQPVLPPGLRAALSDTPTPGLSPVLRIDVAGAAAHAPWLTDVATATGASVALLHGGIEHARDEPFGRLFVRLDGAPGIGEHARAALRGRVIDAEVVGYVARPV